MPFYFALPRTGNTSSQGRQTTGRVEYLRTAPTNLTFTTMKPINRLQTYLSNNLHGIAMSALAGKQSGTFDKAFKLDCSSRLLYPSVDSDNTIPITLPKMSFRFNNLSDNQIERLDVLGMEERNVKGKGKVWVGALNPQQAKEVISFGIQGSYAAIGGTVSVDGIAVINKILRLITLSAQALTMVNMGGNAVRICEFGNRVDMPLKVYNTATMSEVKLKEGKLAMTLSSAAPDIVLALHQLPKVTGSLAELQDIVAHGIFCPFEPNYSATDRKAIHSLLADFSCLAAEERDFDDFDEHIVNGWTREVCLTMEGEFIAHMISSLCLAKKIGARICFLVTGNLYEGAILHGANEFSFKLVGGATYRSKGKEDLIEDVLRYAFHSTTLESMLEEVGIGEDVNPRDIKTMRQLRNVIIGRVGSISATTEATLAKKLVFLNFREKPEPINPSSLSKFFSYIHPTSPTVIPESVYLDRRAFFSKDPIEVALSMFGMYAPSPIITGQVLVLAVAPNSNKRASTEPPSIQFCLKELSVSAKDWEGFLRGGSIVQPSQKIRRGRRFAGTDKSQIWGHMTTLAAAGLSAQKNEVVAARNDREAEKRDREDRQDPSNDAKRVRVEAIDFSMFNENTMQE